MLGVYVVVIIYIEDQKVLVQKININSSGIVKTLLETLYKLFYRTETRRSTLGLDKNLPC